MKLYEIDNAILECIDLETGEVLDEERLNELHMERDAKVENLALWYKNLLSDAEQLKAEKDAFAKREKSCKNKAESIKSYLDRVLGGEAFKTMRVAVSYRTSEALVIDDWKKVDNEYLVFDEPTVDKTAVKNAIKAGKDIDGVHIEKRSNISIK